MKAVESFVLGAGVSGHTAAMFAKRYFLPWQIYRFIVINIKMLKMMSKGH
jgi:hypothetical protein